MRRSKERKRRLLGISEWEEQAVREGRSTVCRILRARGAYQNLKDLAEKLDLSVGEIKEVCFCRRYTFSDPFAVERIRHMVEKVAPELNWRIFLDPRESAVSTGLQVVRDLLQFESAAIMYYRSGYFQLLTLPGLSGLVIQFGKSEAAVLTYPLRFPVGSRTRLRLNSEENLVVTTLTPRVVLVEVWRRTKELRAVFEFPPETLHVPTRTVLVGDVYVRS